jgi:hypothetical protein
MIIQNPSTSSKVGYYISVNWGRIHINMYPSPNKKTARRENEVKKRCCILFYYQQLLY